MNKLVMWSVDDGGKYTNYILNPAEVEERANVPEVCDLFTVDANLGKVKVHEFIEKLEESIGINTFLEMDIEEQEDIIKKHLAFQMLALTH